MSRYKNKVFHFVTLGHYQSVLTSNGKNAYGIRFNVRVNASGSKPGFAGFPISGVWLTVSRFLRHYIAETKHSVTIHLT